MKTAESRQPVHIGKVVRNARVFNFRNPPGGSLNDSALLEAVDRLFALLEERQIDYLLVGGIALLQYVEGRNTEDIDLIMSLSSLERLPELRKVGQEDDFARADFAGLQIDLLLISNPLFDEVHRRHATRQRFAEREIPCATPEGLVLLKLYALPSLYRQGNVTRRGPLRDGHPHLDERPRCRSRASLRGVGAPRERHRPQGSAPDRGRDPAASRDIPAASSLWHNLAMNANGRFSARVTEFVAENRIRTAIEEGKFDNLAGTGRPLSDIDEPYDPDWWVKNVDPPRAGGPDPRRQARPRLVLVPLIRPSPTAGVTWPP